jgi:hypothetical protein
MRIVTVLLQWHEVSVKQQVLAGFLANQQPAGQACCDSAQLP